MIIKHEMRNIMGENKKPKFRIRITKQYPGMWSFGICLSHDTIETYIYINLIKYSIAIGLLCDY